MTTRIMFALGFAVCAAATVARAEITVIDFEEFAQEPGSFIEVGGFTTDSNVTFGSNDAFHYFQNALEGADNGSTYLALQGREGANVLSAPSETGAPVDPFTLVSIDLAENRTTATAATSVRITGLIDGGGQFNQVVALDGILYDTATTVANNAPMA